MCQKRGDQQSVGACAASPFFAITPARGKKDLLLGVWGDGGGALVFNADPAAFGGGNNQQSANSEPASCHRPVRTHAGFKIIAEERERSTAKALLPLGIMSPRQPQHPCGPPHPKLHRQCTTVPIDRQTSRVAVCVARTQ